MVLPSVAASVLPEVCVCYLLRSTANGDEVLLGRKKFGLGQGNLVGPGGKLEPGESALEAVLREVREETSIVISNPRLVGELIYPFATKPAWSQKSWVFTCREFSGIAAESVELEPEWYSVASIPLDRMWDDARYWLPAVLAREAATASAADLASAGDPAARANHSAEPWMVATFEFGPDLRTVVASDHAAFASGKLANQASVAGSGSGSGSSTRL